jgi:tRNA 5-methylaminomethyl-2-thiouridine biosynthesis bifunctional protein
MQELQSINNTLEWRDGQPYSSLYGDVYYSTDIKNPQQGLDETDYVFLQHNHLAQRWQSLANTDFVIAETGFGTGLNFLSACQLWLKTAPVSAKLHFISVEKHPLTRDELSQTQAMWPSFNALSNNLLEQYGDLGAGLHNYTFFDGRITLSLLIGDACQMLSQLQTKMDAWFLDGFSPAKNPDMWQQALYMQIARLSKTGTTFATFTSAGMVRRGLLAVGFNVKKTTGYGKKREMSYGQFGSE